MTVLALAPEATRLERSDCVLPLYLQKRTPSHVESISDMYAQDDSSGNWQKRCVFRYRDLPCTTLIPTS